MKNALIHQSSEYDCGPTCMVNAIRYLFEREEIQPGVLKHIWVMGNDTYCDKGCLGCHGTSRASMRYMADWLREYGRGCCFPVYAEFLCDGDAVMAPGTKAWDFLQQGGCVIMRCYADKIPHYVLLTAVLPGDEVGLFDPYEEDPEFEGEGRRVVAGYPKQMNRAVRYDLLNLEDMSDYAMGKYDVRELVLIRRTDRDKNQKAG